MDPLVVGVIVNADQIEIVGASAELRTESARDHVPGLKLRLTISFSGRRLFRVIRIDGDMNDGFRVTNARAGIHFAHRLDRGDRSAHELGLEFMSAMFCKRIQEAGIATAPRYE